MNKSPIRYIYIACLLFFSIVAIAQPDSWCGTKAPESFLRAYTAKDRSNYGAINAERSSIRWVGVWYHLITQNDGTGGVKLKNVLDTHCELNEVYNAFNIGFYIAGVDTIANSTLWQYQETQLGISAFSQYNQPNVCNIYVNGNLPGLCGFATFPNTAPAGGGIFLNKECVGAGTTTLPHEMGHYFGLLHTFDTSNGVEFVNGTNCTTAGDLFCDTPADFLDNRTACPYTGNQTDPNGDLYKTVIDPSLFMSYFNDNCVNRFSPMQQAEMNTTLTVERTPLLNQDRPDLNPLDSALFISPANDDDYVNNAGLLFRWHPVPRAIWYSFRLQNPTANLVYVDTLIRDTVFNAGALLVGMKYKFIVKPYSYGNTCATNATYQFIQTSTIKVNIVATPYSCSNTGTGKIIITPSKGVAPYSFYLNNTPNDSIITDLTPGYYQVDVIDASGNANSTVVQISGPAPLSASITSTGNQLVAQATGGSSPYTYKWNNNVTGADNSNIAIGNYVVTVTDVKGCTTTQDFTYTSLYSIPESKVVMKVFPNPLRGNNTLQVNVELNEKVHGIISLVDMNGQVVEQIAKDLTSGVNNCLLNVSQLPPGIYLVRFVSGNAIKTERFSLLK